jgi:hypothetical protein
MPAGPCKGADYSPGVADPHPSTPPDELADEVRRLADHLRRLPESRLRRRPDALGGATTAEAAHALAQWYADAAARLADPDAPVRRAVPRLSDLAVADQVAVTGADLVSALAATDPVRRAAPLAEAAARTAALRRLT